MAALHRSLYSMWFLASVALLCLIEYWVIESATSLPATETDIIALAITIDLMAGIPLLGFFR